MTPFSEAARQIVRALEFEMTFPLPGIVESIHHAGEPLSWRHHGLGMLQAELSETLRIHVWHPKLVSPGMAWPRCVHDHRFDITSAVVIGEVIDVLCRVREVPEPFSVSLSRAQSWVHVYEIEHAKNQDRMVLEKGCSTATSARKLARAYVEESGVEHHRTGESYKIARREFHTTRVEGLSITVVHRANFDTRLARVLCAIDSDVTAVSGIVRDESDEHTAIVNSVLLEAADATSTL